jgi:hypothetical protein
MQSDGNPSDNERYYQSSFTLARAPDRQPAWVASTADLNDRHETRSEQPCPGSFALKNGFFAGVSGLNPGCASNGWINIADCFAARDLSGVCSAYFRADNGRVLRRAPTLAVGLASRPRWANRSSSAAGFSDLSFEPIRSPRDFHRSQRIDLFALNGVLGVSPRPGLSGTSDGLQSCKTVRAAPAPFASFPLKLRREPAGHITTDSWCAIRCSDLFLRPTTRC